MLTDGEPGSEYWAEFHRFQRSAWRWEHQPAYYVGYERDVYDKFLAGNPAPPTDSKDLADWMAQVRRQVSEGKTVGRVRVVDDPPTDYQRWMSWMSRWNREAGEDIDCLTRKRALEVGLPAAGGEEWWLFDDERLVLIRHDATGRRVQAELLVDEPEVAQARRWRELAVQVAHEESSANT